MLFFKKHLTCCAGFLGSLVFLGGAASLADQRSPAEASGMGGATPFSSADSGAGRSVVVIDGMSFCLLSPGLFMMGGELAASEVQRIYGAEGITQASLFESEHPAHEVQLSKAFFLGQHEVTVGEFRTFVKAKRYKTEAEREGWAWGWEGLKWGKTAGACWKNPGWTPRDEEPVTCLSWNDAEAYVAWLKKKTGKAYRLPTEAEWEYACRAGSSTAFPWGSETVGAWERLNAADQTPSSEFVAWDYSFKIWDNHFFAAPVGTYKPNDWGLHDMPGNVTEWCADWYGPYTGERQVDPAGAVSGEKRVARGGAWTSGPARCRSASRSGISPSYRSSSLGFRIALTQGESLSREAAPRRAGD